jgi:PKD repeat protein
VTGEVRPWAVNQTIQNYGTDSAISALTTDGEQVFGVGWTFFSGGGTGNFEGVFAADPITGNMNWVDGGRGDNYGIAVTGNVVYSVGHPHDWGMVGWNPQYDPYEFQRTLAINKYKSPTLTDAYGTSSIWQPFMGKPAAQPLHWLPTLTGGTYSGKGQAAWSVATNGDYVVEGGEFPRVNGIAQQGLVRFAKRSISPTVDPIQGYTDLTPVLSSAGPGSVRVGWMAAWDRDNELLKVEVLRGELASTSTVLKTFTTRTTWWNRPPLAFIDTTAPPGTTQTYRVRVTDPFGNGFAGPPSSMVVPAGTPPTSQYASTVGIDNPDWQWRLDEASGTTAFDRAGTNNLTLNSTTRNISGAMLNESNAATNFPGSTNTNTVQSASSYWQDGPQTFSLESWVRTSTNQGGQIIGFGDSRTGRSGTDNSDRILYMNNNGQIYFGVRPDMGTRTTINSPSTYRDNNWHYVVATLGADGMKLYVDGNVVASNANVKKGQVYRGWWKVGGDRLSSWPSTPSRESINANLDEVAVYPKALTVGHIRAHYLASGRTTVFPNILPTPSFSSTSHYLTGIFDGTGSFDDDGTIASYAWNFGDGSTGTGATPQHLYAGPGTYTVGLTVTDNRGGIASITSPITVVSPPANIPPVPSFTAGVVYRTATFTSTSTDEDGTIVSANWDFGDGTTGSGNSVQHPYAAAGTYPISLSVTDSRGDTQVATGTVTITDLYAADKFGRTVANGLGTADNGGPWTLSGTAANFAVNGGTAKITGAVSQNRAGYMTSARQTDLDLRQSLSLNVVSNGGGAYVSIIGRRVSTGNDYRLKLRYMADGRVNAYLVRLVGNVETILTNITVPGITANPGDVLRTRFLITGTNPTTVRAKIWRKGTMEPAAWLLTATDNTPAVLQAPGDSGVLLYLSGSWVGTLPVLSLDDVKIGPDSGPPVNTPPTASFTSQTEYRTAFFDGGASSDSDEDGSVSSFNWNFGDGTTGTGINPQHTYATGDTYNVTLTVTDNGGVTGSVTQPVVVQDPPPPSAFFETNVAIWSADFDASGSNDVAGGSIVAYNWNFGDGTMGAGVNPHHDYTAAGTYTVTLNVVDNEGNIGTADDTLVLDPLPPPTASFTATPNFRDVQFDGTASTPTVGTITSYAWDFGDGATGSGVTAQHTYATASTYHVTLTVTDSYGGIGTQSSDVTVANAPPPTASFTATPTYLSTQFNATASSVQFGTISSYAWDFGDGTTGSGATTQHTYATANTYHVTLTVTGSLGGTGTQTSDVVATDAPAPTASFTATPTFRSVQFDGSASNVSAGTISSYTWDFGDGTTGTGATASHTYATANTYPVTLTVTGSFGGSGTKTSDVVATDPPPPTASFTATPTYLTAQFNGSGSSVPFGTITSYAWDFGDGTSGTGATTSRTYATPGTYHVTLTVTGSLGGTGTKTSDVVVTDPPPPTASFTATPNFLNVQFNGTGSSTVVGTITSYAWNFGDTSSGTGPTPAHLYAGAGTYPVTLTVTDSNGHTGTASSNVTVVAAPVKYATDTFTRTVANGLGSAEVGGAYTLSGAATSFSVGSGRGRMTNAIGGTRAAYLTAVSRTEIDFLTDVSLDLASTGGGAYVSIIGRRVANGTDYRVKLRYMPNGTVIAYLARTVASTETILANITVPGLTLAAGDTLRVRFQLTGTTNTTVRAKVWRQAAAEPASWLVSTTDATPAVLRTAGDVGVMHYVSGSWTGPAPTLSFDNLDISPPPA